MAKNVFNKQGNKHPSQNVKSLATTLKEVCILNKLLQINEIECDLIKVNFKLLMYFRSPKENISVEH